MRKRKISAAVGINVGLKRSNNEDNFYLNGTYLNEKDRDSPATLVANADAPLQFYAVCDGMGGEAFGEIASLIAVKTVQKYQEMLSTINYHSIDKYIDMYIAEVNNLITEQSNNNDGIRIGTTIALVCFEDNMAHCYNIGDSRVYLLRGNKLQQLSEDHTHTVRSVKMGVMTAEEARSHPYRNKLTQHLGMAPEEMIVEPYRFSMRVKKNDKFLLCSDGVTDMIEDKEIEYIMKQKQDEGVTTVTLIKAAIQNGGNDNITALVAKVTG
jgi:protein phosphatase